MPSSPHPSPGDPHDRDLPPRAFATATGYALQIVGGLLVLSSCCLWSGLSWFLDPSGPSAVRRTVDLDEGVEAPFVANGVMFLTLLGGLALLAGGIGLQGERRGSGAFSAVVAGLVALGYAGAGLFLLRTGAAPALGVVALLFALIATVLFLLAAHSHQVMRRHPPPADLNVVDDEFLAEHSRRRASRSVATREEKPAEHSAGDSPPGRHDDCDVSGLPPRSG
jgi:hypothetical protein